MKLNPDTLTTVFGLVASASQLLGQVGVIDTNTAGIIASTAVALLGIFSNKSK